jgi:hypothetical protein
LFGAKFANVQPHSGASANLAVYLALLQPNDTIMGMSLAEGGHLTHGMALNLSGKWFNVISYGLNDKEEIDYAQMEKLAHEKKPKLIIAGASAYSLRIDWEFFAKVASLSGVKAPRYPVGLVLSGLGWRFSAMAALFTGKRPMLTKQSARAAMRRVIYKSENLPKVLPDFRFIPLAETLPWALLGIRNQV